MAVASPNILANEGVDIAICARKDEGLQEAVAALQAKGVKACSKVVDVSKADEYKGFITEAAEALGGLDIFVHNVSAMVGQGEEGWMKSFQIDMMGAVRGAEAAQPYLEKSQSGSVIFIGTTAALENFGPPNPYSAMKLALLAYTNDLAQALARKGIRVSTVSPGSIYFKGGAWLVSRKACLHILNKRKKSIPFVRCGTPKK